jgi:hypothetical protein
MIVINEQLTKPNKAMKRETTPARRSERVSLTSISRGLKMTFLTAAAIVCTAGISAAITISGEVKDDGNGGNISGTSVSSIQGNQLFVYLVNNSNVVVARSAVSSTTLDYSLTGSANTNYSVIVSTLFYNVGYTNPILGMPASIAPTAEGVTSAGDGTPDYAVAINSSGDLTVNFALDVRPVGFSYNLNNPSYDADSNIIIPAAAFTASDFEDGTYTPGFSGRDIDLFQAAGGELYYDGTLITFSSASTATRIANFDVSLLRFKPMSGATHQFAFATVDNAGKPEFVPNSIIINLTPGSTNLPIDLVFFNAGMRGDDAQLTWQTATEKGNKGFTVERSDDGVRYSSIATIGSQAQEGNSGQMLNYNFTDANAAASSKGAIYYRIRQTDINGTFTYSKTIRLATGKSTMEQLAMYPNPSTGVLNLDLATGSAANETLYVTVMGTAGNVVINRSYQVGEGRLSTSLDLSTLPAGTYYVKLTGAGTSEQARQFVLLPH